MTRLPKVVTKFSRSLKRLLTPRPMFTVMEIQSSPIFRLPDEILLAIFAVFPVFKWSELYYRYSHARHTSHTPIPDVYRERSQTLLALSATCQMMRYRLLPEAWGRSLLCLEGWDRDRVTPARLGEQCRTLLKARSLAAYVGTMTVDLACDGTETILETFVRCLAVLPNLHTLEVTSVESDYLFYNTMNGTKLPQIRTLILPSMAHHLLRHCPNVEDFTCTNFRPDEELAKSLAKGQRKLKTLAVLFSGDSITWKNSNQVYPLVRVWPPVLWDTMPEDTRNCLAALPNLSTLQIIYLVPYREAGPICDLELELEVFQVQAQHRSSYGEVMEKKIEGRWNEMKVIALDHLKSCSGPGPKVLRTAVVNHNRASEIHSPPVARMEEIQVCK